MVGEVTGGNVCKAPHSGQVKSSDETSPVFI